MSHSLRVLFVLVLILTPGYAVAAGTDKVESGPKPSAAAKKRGKTITMGIFLDRLMLAESGGNDQAKNALSTALGPFQFIKSTFLDVAERHFPKDIEKLNTSQILALRTDRAFARKAAEAYTRDNAAVLAAAGIKPTFPHLRLAYLLGASGAIKILSAPPKTRLFSLLGPAVIKANPFMARLTAGGLVRRAAADILTDPATTAGIKPGKLPRGVKRRPRIRVRCNLGRPSCRRWLALKRRKLNRKARRKTRVSKR